eukprot:381539-Rhodomonas_salina.1
MMSEFTGSSSRAEASEARATIRGRIAATRGGFHPVPDLRGMPQELKWGGKERWNGGVEGRRERKRGWAGRKTGSGKVRSTVGRGRGAAAGGRIL